MVSALADAAWITGALKFTVAMGARARFWFSAYRYRPTGDKREAPKRPFITTGFERR
jgi:hypothetical protein